MEGDAWGWDDAGETRMEVGEWEAAQGQRDALEQDAQSR